MVEKIFSDYKVRGNEKILDAGCGEGIFAVIAAQNSQNYQEKNRESN